MRFGFFTNGITATPVSKPESPSASLGKTSRDKPITIKILLGSSEPLAVLKLNKASLHAGNFSGC